MIMLCILIFVLYQYGDNNNQSCSAGKSTAIRHILGSEHVFFWTKKLLSCKVALSGQPVKVNSSHVI